MICHVEMGPFEDGELLVDSKYATSLNFLCFKLDDVPPKDVWEVPETTTRLMPKDFLES